jgi:glycosyltransferase involved in cell wall biosynthesis
MATATQLDLPRLLVFTAYPPCTAYGGGIILRNLLREYPRDRITVITNRRFVDAFLRQGEAEGLRDAPHVEVAPWQSRLRRLHRLMIWLNVTKIPSSALWSARRAGRETVLLVIPSGEELGSEFAVAGYLAHRVSGAPLVVYEMDEWRAATRTAGWNSRLLERLFHRRLLHAARAVWVVSQPMAEALRERFGTEARVLPNGVDVERFARGRRGERANPHEFRLLFTGAVYGPQAGAIRNVLQAIQARLEDRISLFIYTPQSAAELAELGISGSGLRVQRTVPLESMPELLGTADALLLPFSFDPRERAVVSTSLPSKTADYLASGVPVLVHAPPYTTIARLARDEGWAEIVDEPCIEHLTLALGRLATDDRLRARLVANALRVARAQYDLEPQRAAFLASIRRAVVPNG